MSTMSTQLKIQVQSTRLNLCHNKKNYRFGPIPIVENAIKTDKKKEIHHDCHFL